MRLSPTLIRLALAFAAIMALAACRTAPVPAPEGLDAPTLVQRAQEASDLGAYDQAGIYYQALLERYGADPALRVAGEYELGVLARKQGRTAEARAALASVIERYEGPDAAALPPRYLVLARKLLASLE